MNTKAKKPIVFKKGNKENISPQDELNSELPLKESSSLDEQQTLDCKIPEEVLLKLKCYIFIHSQKEEGFSLNDLEKEFNVKFGVPSNVDLERELLKLDIIALKYDPIELQKLGIVLKYDQYKTKMTPKPQFLADYARQNLSVCVERPNVKKSHRKYIEPVQNINIVEKNVTEKKQFECFKCEFSASSMLNLKRHIKLIHEDKKKFECEHCDFSHENNKGLYNHVKLVHKTNKAFKCDTCEYSLKTPDEKKKETCEVCQFL